MCYLGLQPKSIKNEGGVCNLWQGRGIKYDIQVVKGIIGSTGTVCLFAFPGTNFMVYCYSILWTLFIGNSQ